MHSTLRAEEWFNLFTERYEGNEQLEVQNEHAYSQRVAHFIHSMAEKNWFDNNITKVRKRKKITQKELAKKMRVSQARVSRIENPDYRPSAGVYERAAKALGCGLTDLI